MLKYLAEYEHVWGPLRLFSSHTFRAVMATVTALLIGFIIGQFAADESEILTIGVAPEFQRHGVGKMLVEGLVRAVQRACAWWSRFSTWRSHR